MIQLKKVDQHLKLLGKETDKLINFAEKTLINNSMKVLLKKLNLFKLEILIQKEFISDLLLRMKNDPL